MTTTRHGGPSRRQFLDATIGLGMATVLAGCGDGGDGGTPTQTPAASLEIDRIQFVAERPTGYREYQPVQDKTYELGGAAWVYFEPAGVATESTDSGAERIELTLEATFTDADGDVIQRETEPIENELTGDQSTDELFLWAGTNVPTDAAPGTWQVELALTDEVADTTASITREFEVEGGDGPTTYLEAFDSTIRSDTEAQIGRLELQNSTVELAYESIYETRGDDWEREVGFIAGVYSGLVGQGWEAQRLSVTTTGSGGTTVTWHVDRSTALAFVNEEISQSEFGRRILETIEEQ